MKLFKHAIPNVELKCMYCLESVFTIIAIFLKEVMVLLLQEEKRDYCDFYKLFMHVHSVM